MTSTEKYFKIKHGLQFEDGTNLSTNPIQIVTTATITATNTSSIVLVSDLDNAIAYYSNTSSQWIFAFDKTPVPHPTGGGGGGGGGDPFVDANTLMMLYLNNNFTDAAGNASNFQAVGNGATFNSSDKYEGAYSLDWGDGPNSNGYSFDATNLDIGSGDFTIEAWVKVPDWLGNAYYSGSGGSDAYYRTLLSWGDYSVALNMGGGSNTNSTWNIQIWHSGSADISGNVSIPENQWVHVAWSRLNGVFYSGCNGAVQNRGSDSGSLTKSGSHYYLGWMPYHHDMGFTTKLDCVRVSNIARYTDTNNGYTPPTFSV